MKLKNNDGKYWLKSQQVQDIYHNLTMELIDNIIRRLKQRGTQDLIDNPYIWQLEKLNDMHLLTEANVKSIARQTGVAEKVFRDVIANEGFKIYKNSHEQLTKALKVDNQPDYKVQDSLNALASQTMFEVNNLINTTLPKSLQRAYKDTLENVVASVVSGSKSDKQAISDAVIKMYEKGFTGFIDRGGRNWGIERYVRTVIRTTTFRTYREMRERSADELGVDTFYYSSKLSAREMCAPLQHKIVTKGVARVIQGEQVYSLADYGYGKPGGCLGINCGHYLTPFVIGVNEKPDLPEYLEHLTEDDLKKNALDKARFRAYNREININKDKQHIAKSLDDKELLNKLKLRNRTLLSGRKLLVESNPTVVGKYLKNKVTDADLMANSKEFRTTNNLGDSIRFRAKQVKNSEYNIWLQDSTKRIRDTFELVEQELKHFNNIPTIVILKNSKLNAIAGYSYKDDILYISDILNSEKSILEVLSDGYFAAKDLRDILTHELAHKQHWDSAKNLYKYNKKRYNNVKEAKIDLDSKLTSYVKKQTTLDVMYSLRISRNATDAFYVNNINELVADVKVLGDRCGR